MRRQCIVRFQKIEYWTRLGKVAEENPERPIGMLQDMLISIDAGKVGNLTGY